MICKTSFSISRARPDTETSVTCELTCDGEEGSAKLSAGHLRWLQDACLTMASAEAGLPADWSVNRSRSATGLATLRQLARLYRAAMRIASFDPTQLQVLCQRLYQKRPEELSILEVRAMIGTFNAVARGTIDVKHVFADSAFAINGHAGKPLA